jgi:nitrogen fixation protein FixH
MKRILSALIALMVVAGTVSAGQLNSVKKAGDTTVKVVIENSPLTVGDNAASIEILDEKGEAITDAHVTVYFFMPSMSAMNYEVPASRSGNGYAAVIKPTMPGVWDADINVTLPGGEKRTATVSFNAQ